MDTPDLSSPPAGDSGRARPWMAAVLALSLLGLVVLLALFFQPYASAAGGCGGG